MLVFLMVINPMALDNINRIRNLELDHHWVKVNLEQDQHGVKVNLDHPGLNINLELNLPGIKETTGTTRIKEVR